MSKREIEITDANAQQPTLPLLDISATFMPQSDVHHTPNIPNLVTDLFQRFLFPQAPAGTKAQGTALHANLHKTISQAVHQLTTGPSPSDASVTFAIVAPAPITSMKTNDEVAPASDPKWFFPPPPATPHPCPVSQSRPLPHHKIVATAEEAAQKHKDVISIGMEEERPVMAPNARPDGSSPTRPQRSSTRSTRSKCKRGRPIMYTFDHKDDVYISKRRIDGDQWKDIKDSKDKWKEWPIHAFHSHWRLIKDKSLHLQETTVTPKDNSGRVASRKQVRHHPRPLPNVGEKRDIGANVKKMDKDVPDDGWSTDELAM